ncbi:hypothetical protein [Lignipirellula cremea]|uniref:Uncharacterized protein n=1 Tax=Lignipirellula cremea TaxID=2528010 RepID=A0A518DUV7_9BACT|nr:hypothetical protein [Lignipirellula cremea]QDU95614.1 hypothetical protein Pla8534_34300 [Lignipirellula cremea]
MMRTVLAALSLVLVMGAMQSASAQQFYAQRQTNNGTPVIYRHASTAAQGFLDGRANNVRAAGDYNYNTSLALINVEIARSMFLDNKLKSVQTYFEMRRQNREGREYENGPRPTQAELARYAKDRAPDRLASYQYEPTFKKLYWPTIFLDPRYDVPRNAINELVRDRSPEDSGLGSENHRLIREQTEAMKELLKVDVETLDPAAYAMCKRFLTSLEFEAQQKADAPAVAALE